MKEEVDTAEVTPVDAAQVKDPEVSSQYVKLRGLPFSINEQEVNEFFGDLIVKRVKILSGFNGKATGEAIVEMESHETASKAMLLDRKEIKKRYIEVFSIPISDGDGAFSSAGANSENDGFIVRLRGVPWSCTEQDVKTFFEGLETSEVVIGTVGGPGTKATGEAFAKFATIEESQNAMEYNNRHMGSRYIEVFQSNHIEFNRAKGLPVPEASHRAGIRPLMSAVTDQYYPPPPHHQSHYDYGGGAGYGDPYGYDSYGSYDPYANAAYGGYDDQSMRLYMRGLPFDADARAIEAFFSPIRVASVKLGITETNRASGDAIAEFDDYDSMVAAMNKNNHRMGRRYVELFYTKDAPGNMKKLMWRDASGPNVGVAPSLDPVINGWGSAVHPAQKRQQIGPVQPADHHHRSYGPPYHSGRGGRGGPPRRGPGGGHPTARAANDAWSSYGYDSGASQWPAHDPYADRHREAHPQHDSSAPSWGSYPQY